MQFPKGEVKININMLKASAIKRLTNNNIAGSLATFFESHSFKYIKGRQSFTKAFDKDITQIVEINKVEWGFDEVRGSIVFKVAFRENWTRVYRYAG
jgi:hypothetical protein